MAKLGRTGESLNCPLLVTRSHTILSLSSSSSPVYALHLISMCCLNFRRAAHGHRDLRYALHGE